MCPPLLLCETSRFHCDAPAPRMWLRFGLLLAAAAMLPTGVTGVFACDNEELYNMDDEDLCGADADALNDAVDLLEEHGQVQGQRIALSCYRGALWSSMCEMDARVLQAAVGTGAFYCSSSSPTGGSAGGYVRLRVPASGCCTGCGDLPSAGLRALNELLPEPISPTSAPTWSPASSTGWANYHPLQCEPICHSGNEDIPYCRQDYIYSPIVGNVDDEVPSCRTVTLPVFVTYLGAVYQGAGEEIIGAASLWEGGSSSAGLRCYVSAARRWPERIRHAVPSTYRTRRGAVRGTPGRALNASSPSLFPATAEYAHHYRWSKRHSKISAVHRCGCCAEPRAGRVALLLFQRFRESSASASFNPRWLLTAPSPIVESA